MNKPSTEIKPEKRRDPGKTDVASGYDSRIAQVRERRRGVDWDASKSRPTSTRKSPRKEALYRPPAATRRTARQRRPGRATSRSRPMVLPAGLTKGAHRTRTREEVFFGLRAKVMRS